FVDEPPHQHEVRYRIITGMVRDFPTHGGIAYTPDDIRSLHGEGKFAIFISMLNAYTLGNDLSLLDQWTARGMRRFGFSYV
ncbi:membrane dipeptidase, partial [Pseudomonas syringae pv. tagetis]|uniref:membrane dipeptidase n=1 Tax=Pseudomonas syringae group genomosp. 7 TaxID=251699 RepID=UPI00376F9188